jgi:hypothetical protein
MQVASLLNRPSLHAETGWQRLQRVCTCACVDLSSEVVDQFNDKAVLEGHLPAARFDAHSTVPDAYVPVNVRGCGGQRHGRECG